MKEQETMQDLVLLMTRCNRRTEGCLTTYSSDGFQKKTSPARTAYAGVRA